VQIFTTYGWIECAGHADRSAYDLNVHSAKSKVNLQVSEALPEPRFDKLVQVRPKDRAKLGKLFRKESTKLLDYLAGLDAESALDIKAKLDDEGKVLAQIYFFFFDFFLGGSAGGRKRRWPNLQPRPFADRRD
jgi:glycyl-tRNA synthetase